MSYCCTEWKKIPAQIRHWASEFNTAVSLPIGRTAECSVVWNARRCLDSPVVESSLTVTGGHSRSFLAAADWVVSGVSATQLTNSR